jgi:hypothetical protein
MSEAINLQTQSVVEVCGRFHLMPVEVDLEVVVAHRQLGFLASRLDGFSRDENLGGKVFPDAFFGKILDILDVLTVVRAAGLDDLDDVIQWELDEWAIFVFGLIFAFLLYLNHVFRHRHFDVVVT